LLLHLLLPLPLHLYLPLLLPPINICHPERAQRVEGPAFAFAFAVAFVSAVAFALYKYLSSCSFHIGTIWHILIYMPSPEKLMQRTAKIFMNNRSQAVRLPKEFQFSTTEVFIRRQGDDVVLSARPRDWSAYLAQDSVASQEFMEGVEDLPVQERKL
jgi:antitoxin VapB